MKRSKGNELKAAPVELTENELGEVAGGGYTGTITLTGSTVIGNQTPSGDGRAEIIVGAGAGAGPHVK